MADIYSKKPNVTRFKRQKTHRGRDIRIATVTRRSAPSSKRTLRAMRPLRKKVA